MKITAVNTIYFSPTGGTEKAAVTVRKVWKQSGKSIDLTDTAADYSQYRFAMEELCIFAVPAFGGRVPRTALERIKKIKGTQTAAVLVVTYGNRAYDDAFLELKHTLADRGFISVAAIAAVTEHSIIRQFGAGRPDAEDKKELEAYGHWISRYLEKAEKAKETAVPGKEPYREFAGVPMKPKAGKRCTGCGRCAKTCPTGAIPVGNPKATDSDRCISCMRCIGVCPGRARKCSPFVLFAARCSMKKYCMDRKENELILEALE